MFKFDCYKVPDTGESSGVSLCTRLIWDCVPDLKRKTQIPCLICKIFWKTLYSRSAKINFFFAICSDWDCILNLEKFNLLPISKLKLHFCLMNIKIQKAAYCFLSLKLIWFWPLWVSIHLKSSIFKELRVAKVSVVLKGIEGAAVGDATYIHVRALRVKTL